MTAQLRLVPAAPADELIVARASLSDPKALPDLVALVREYSISKGRVDRFSPSHAEAEMRAALTSGVAIIARKGTEPIGLLTLAKVHAVDTGELLAIESTHYFTKPSARVTGAANLLLKVGIECARENDIDFYMHVLDYSPVPMPNGAGITRIGKLYVRQGGEPAGASWLRSRLGGLFEKVGLSFAWLRAGRQKQPPAVEGADTQRQKAG